MNNDIRPRRTPQQAPQATISSPTSEPGPAAITDEQLRSIDDRSMQLSELDSGRLVKPRRRLWLWILVPLVAVALLFIGCLVWYSQALRPVQPGTDDTVSVTIASGSSPDQIASQLKASDLIRSELAFSIYTRLAGVRGQLQAGDYQLSPADDLATIVEQLQRGQLSEFEITFYPGATLFDPTDISDNRRTDVYTMLRRAGYSDEQVRAGLAKTYQHPLLAGKPSDASLEGYVYGDTYRFARGTSVEDILQRTFDEFYSQITDRGLLAKLKQQDMNLYQGIILASIIEREVGDQPSDQRQVSQIFHLRLDRGMPLGADATFMYAAQQQNATPSTEFDSPYNTRIHNGLPPGPISSPSILALEAAALPATGDYLYFVSGDDGKTHFARSLEEHEQNTRRYCTDLCYSIE